MERFEDALKALDKAVKANAYEARTYLYRGMTLAQLQKRKEAEADLKKAIELNPDGTEAYKQLGLLLESLGRPADAIPYFRKFIGRNPKDYSAMLELAELHRRSGNNQAARKLCEQVLLYADDAELKQHARQMIASF